MTRKIVIICLLILTVSCNKEIIRINEPFSFKQFQIQKSTLENKEIILQNVYYFRFSTNIQVSAGNENCYILLISEKPEKSVQKDHDKEIYESIYPPDNFLACYIPTKDIKTIEALMSLKNEDKIFKITGIGKYPSMMENEKNSSDSCITLKAFNFKIPHSTIGIFVNSIEFATDPK